MSAAAHHQDNTGSPQAERINAQDGSHGPQPPAARPQPPAAGPQPMLTSYVAAAQRLLAKLEAAECPQAQAFVRDRLRASVVRPLGGGIISEPSPAASECLELEQLDQSTWELALGLTRLQAARGLPSGVSEAAAALADLSVRGPQLPPHTDTAARRAELARVLADVEPQVVVAADGPYLATNVQDIEDWLGQPHGLAAHVALCRCGASQLKPLCDGSHATIGFSGSKDSQRTPDRRDAYPSVSLTVLDNRGTCAHSGLCTDRLGTVFHAEGDPFVTPNGGRMDEIIRAVRECPSGALSFALDGREARDDVDRTDRRAAIEVSRDGPYRVTGRIRLLDDAVADVERNAGASLEHYSLCRCGQSRNKPFCSGRHWEVHFSDPPTATDTTPTLFEWVGGLPALRRLTRRFYETHVPTDPLLAPLFAQMTPDHPERVAAWLAEVFGGPKGYSDHYGGYAHMVSEHMGAHLTEAQRARFVELLCRSADDVRLPADAEFRAAFIGYLEWGSRIAVENSQPGAVPPQHLPVPRWWWVCDATPGARVSSVGPQADSRPEPELPGTDTPLSFAQHIKPLFRPTDRQSMRFAFDLWSHADVAEHAPAILSRLEAGSMPCDGAWAQPKLEVFKRWVASGTPE